MFNRDYLKKYLLRGLIAASVYCIAAIVFLSKATFQSVWVLFLGNALYMVAVAIIIYFSNRAHKFTDSPLSSTISGHILSITGAALSVILSLIICLIFAGVASSEHTTETLRNAPAGMPHNSTRGIVFVVLVVAALGNTITGFFAALFTSFMSSQSRINEEAS